MLVVNFYSFPILHYFSTPVLQYSKKTKTPSSKSENGVFWLTRCCQLVMGTYLYLSKTSAGLVVLPVALGKSVAT